MSLLLCDVVLVDPLPHTKACDAPCP